MANPAITLKFEKNQNIETGKFILDVSISSNTEIDREIFVFRMITTTGKKEFCAIASVVQLLNFSKFSPGPGEVFFLTDTVSLEFNSAQEMLDAKEFIEKDVDKLLDDWKLVKDDLGEVEEISLEAN